MQHVQTKEKKQTKVICNSSEDYHRLMKETYFEQYFDLIKQWTFKSVLFPISVETAQAIKQAFKATQSKDENERIPGYDWKSNNHLVQLARTIDEKKIELGVNDLFVRLSSRSPKDAIFGGRGRTLYRQALEKLRRMYEEMGETPDETNLKIHALYITGTEALRVQNGDMAIDLLISSDRIQGDLDEFIEHPNEEFNVVVREFARFEVELEFRGFVYNKKLTGLTQYNDFCYFPRIKHYKEEILQKVRAFTSELSNSIPLDHYICDFIMISDTPDEGPFTNMRVWIVEINPLAEFAGGGLFTWTEDMEVLTGEKPFEFRIAERPPPNAIENVAGEWKNFIKEEDE